jgi:hypothetical protein
MLELLLSSAINCTDAESIMFRIEANDNLKPIVKIELIETVKESTPQCYWDAHD